MARSATVGDHSPMTWTCIPRPIGLAAMVALAVLAIACGPTANAIRPTLPPRTLQPVPTVAPGATTPQDSAARASVTPIPSGIAQPLPSFPQGAAYEVTGVSATPSGFLAIGFAGTGQGYFGLHQGVTWTSSDGLSWQQSVDPAFVDVSPEYVEALGSDIYVFGYFSTCAEVIDEVCTDDPNAGTVVFKSANGGSWEQLAQTTDMIHAQIDGVTTWNDKLVAWGAAGDDNLTTTVWTSTDGLTWAAITDIAGIDPIDAVTAGGPGLVAFGATYVETIDDTQLVAATSSDGAHFTTANVPAITGGSVLAARTGPGGMAGVGAALSETSPSLGLTLFSPDGINWSQGTATDGSFENTQMEELHSSLSTYVAVGSTIDDLDMTLQTGVMWTSGDGKSWRSLGNFGGVFSQYGASALGAAGLVVFTANEQDAGDAGTDLKSTIYGWFVPSAQLVP